MALLDPNVTPRSNAAARRSFVRHLEPIVTRTETDDKGKTKDVTDPVRVILVQYTDAGTVGKERTVLLHPRHPQFRQQYDALKAALEGNGPSMVTRIATEDVTVGEEVAEVVSAVHMETIPKHDRDVFAPTGEKIGEWTEGHDKHLETAIDCRLSKEAAVFLRSVISPETPEIAAAQRSRVCARVASQLEAQLGLTPEEAQRISDVYVPDSLQEVLSGNVTAIDKTQAAVQQFAMRTDIPWQEHSLNYRGERAKSAFVLYAAQKAMAEEFADKMSSIPILDASGKEVGKENLYDSTIRRLSEKGAMRYDDPHATAKQRQHVLAERSLRAFADTLQAVQEIGGAKVTDRKQSALQREGSIPNDTFNLMHDLAEEQGIDITKMDPAQKRLSLIEGIEKRSAQHLERSAHGIAAVTEKHFKPLPTPDFGDAVERGLARGAYKAKAVTTGVASAFKGHSTDLNGISIT